MRTHAYLPQHCKGEHWGPADRPASRGAGTRRGLAAWTVSQPRGIKHNPLAASRVGAPHLIRHVLRSDVTNSGILHSSLSPSRLPQERPGISPSLHVPHGLHFRSMNEECLPKEPSALATIRYTE